jgi:solute carrier family 13 (sodium-dependent dicarboxylate transporter), member 2/3/5
MSEQHVHHVTPTRLAFQLLGPAVFLVVLFGFHPVPDKPAVGATLAVALWMAIYWFSDAIPMAATALIPIVAFPFLGILSATQVAPLYLNDIIMLFVGGFLIAAAMERWELHRRIALRIILLLGQSPARLLLGFMLAGWLLSQWISNTATTLMMVPIVMAIVAGFEERVGEAARPLTVCLLLGIAYAASIGGIATLIGTPPNLALAEIFRLTFDAAPPITFLRWLLFGLPVSTVLFVLAFLYLRVAVLRGRTFPLDRELLRREYAALGRMRWEERAVLVVFAAFALLLLTRADIVLGGTTLHGWASRLGVAGSVGDGTVAIGVALILFLIPAGTRRGCLLDTGAVRGLPWDIVVLFGGGFALARAFQASGLSAYLGNRLIALGQLPPVVLVLAICTLLTFLTELTSNTATTQVVLPIIASMCVALDLNPLLLMVPATVSASCAFMLPVATPPNAIVFGTYRLRIADMARAGLVLNLLGIVVVTILMMTLGRWVFGIDLQAPPTWMHGTVP